MVLATVLIIILLNFILSKRFVRWDITADQRYTLKDATIELLQDDERFAAPVHIKIYFTGEFPPEWENFRNEIKLKLDEYKVYGGDHITYSFIDIYENEQTLETELEELQKLGLREIVISDFSESKGNFTNTLPGAVISYPGQADKVINFVPTKAVMQAMQTGDKGYLLSLLDESQIELEFKLTSAISQITLREKPYVAFLKGHDELDAGQTYMAREALKEYYDVGDVDILEVVNDSANQVPHEEQVWNSLNGIDVLIIAKPQKDFQEIEKVVIDQFIMNGGKVIWSIDMMQDFRDTLFYYGGASFYAFENKLNLEDILFKYGVKITPSLIFETSEYRAPSHYPKFKDLGNGPEPVYLVTDWSYYPLVQDYTQKRDGSSPSKPHLITEGIPRVKLEYASFLEIPNRKDGIKRTVLLETSDTTYYRTGAVDITYNLMREQLIKAKQNNLPFEQYLPTAVLLEGKFESIQKNRLLPKNWAKGRKFKITEESTENAMIIISDGDIFKNDIDSLSNPGYDLKVKLTHSIYAMSNPNLRHYYGNRDFLMNSVGYLLGENTILAVRRKFIPNRLDAAKVEENRAKWKFLNTTLPILIIIVFGIVQYFYRKKKYAS